jgi:hypothetical protein
MGLPSMASLPSTANVPSATSVPASSAPTATVTIAAPIKLVGGGARTNYGGNGSLLTQNYPSSSTTWTAVAKDHLSPDPASVTTFAIGINDAAGDWDVGIFQSPPSAVTGHPTASVSLPPGYVLTGGGCVDNWASTGTMGNLLTASYPTIPPTPATPTWECRGKDHQLASPASLTAFAIGIRPTHAGTPMPVAHITTATSGVAELPEVVAPAVIGAIVTGGGARAVPSDPNGSGQLLTGTFPEFSATGAVVGWHAKSKDHMVASPGTVTAYAINVTFPPPVVTSISKPNGQPGDPITIIGAGFGEEPGTVTFQVNPNVTAMAAGKPLIMAWHDTQINVIVPPVVGIASPFGGFLFVQRPADLAQSVPFSFEFDPAYALAELPMPPPNDEMGNPDVILPDVDPVLHERTYWEGGGGSYDPFGYFPGLAGLFGGGVTNEFYVSRRLTNGWTVDHVQVDVFLNFCAFMTVTPGGAAVAGAYMNNPPSSPILGTSNPHLFVRYWSQPACNTKFRPRIWVRGPVGVPYF